MDNLSSHASKAPRDRFGEKEGGLGFDRNRTESACAGEDLV